MMNGFKKWTGAAGVILLAFLGMTAAVQAAAVPVQSSPHEGEVVRRSPAYVSVTFSDALEPFESKLEVLAEDGRKVDRSDCGIDVADPSRKTMVATLKPDLPPGVYTVRWTTVSQSGGQLDGYTVQGQFDFTIAPSIVQLILIGAAIMLGTIFVSGGWVGFGLTYRRLRRLESNLQKNQAG